MLLNRLTDRSLFGILSHGVFMPQSLHSVALSISIQEKNESFTMLKRLEVILKKTPPV